MILFSPFSERGNKGDFPHFVGSYVILNLPIKSLSISLYQRERLIVDFSRNIHQLGDGTACRKIQQVVAFGSLLPLTYFYSFAILQLLYG